MTAARVIYTLSDPRDGAPRYVGQSNCPSGRLVQHIDEARVSADPTLKDQWIRGLLGAGVRPALSVVESDVAPDDRMRRERHWIDALASQGAELLNADSATGAGPVTRTSIETAALVARFCLSSGFPPTRRDIGALLGLPSRSAVTERVQSATRHGLLTRAPGRSRGVVARMCACPSRAVFHPVGRVGVPGSAERARPAEMAADGVCPLCRGLVLAAAH